MFPTQQIRHFHMTVSRLVRGIGRRNNPGVGHRLSLEDNFDEHVADDPEVLQDLEADFMNIHQTHREHEREMAHERERIRHHMVKHKYFREPKLPNLLTYAEKEQIRMLNSRDPVEWSAERLAESFPATKEIIQKLISAKWHARTIERIRKHDESVIQNWEKFRSNPKALQLPPDLQAHLQKFASRRTEDLRVLAEELPEKPALPRPKTQVFSSIITSCDKYAEKDINTPQLTAGRKSVDIRTPPAAAAEDETYLLEKVHDRRRMRLQELKELKLSPHELSASINESSNNGDKSKTTHDIEHHTVAVIQNPSGTGIISNNALSELNLYEKYQSSEIVISVEDQRRFEITRVKDRIHIPRKLWREGATYRVEDAYYDDDGEFLYRVPGMKG